MGRFACFAALVAALVLTGAEGFVTPNAGVASISTTVLSSDAVPEGALTYAEESRKYRRTVFTHDDWVRHRSPDRLGRNLKNLFVSGVYRSIGREVLATTSVAVFVIVWNALLGGYTDFSGEAHGAVIQSALPILALPLEPFSLSNPLVGLLLTFRANTSYKRWDEARKNWGMNINHTRDLVRMGVSYYDMSARSKEERQEDLQALSLATWSFVRSMKRHLSPAWEDEEAFKAELREKLPAEQAEAIINANHRPNRALSDLSLAIENLPMHFIRKNEIHQAVTIFEDNLGSSERLLTSPVPLFYSRHTARFLGTWLLLVPFALYKPFESSWNHIAMVPAVAFLSVFLFGIEELAAQLEEPFTILPMQGFCDKIGNWCNEIVSWTPGDNGMTIKKAEARHVAIWDTELGPVPVEGNPQRLQTVDSEPELIAAVESADAPESEEKKSKRERAKTFLKKLF